MTDQLNVWKSQFGDQYTDRNPLTPENIRNRVNMWSEILHNVHDLSALSSMLEIGANIGLNLVSFSQYSDATLYATEPNTQALELLRKQTFIDPQNTNEDTIFDLSFEDSSMDMVMTSGVLIHIHPNDLLKATTEMVRVTRKYILCIEYFSHDPEEIQYRDQANFLFKRDFGDFFLENHPELSVKDYGFLWKRTTGLSNMTWFLLEKSHGQ